MERLDHRLSIFSHTADRGTAVAYLLGAVVPLVCLGIVLERYVLTPLMAPPDRFSVLAPVWILALFGSVAILSLSCFFMLRRLVGLALEENRALAYYDSLTGLPNRRMYTQRLEQSIQLAQRDGTLVAVCFLDLDEFKRINDTLGHSNGDWLLCQVGKRLLGSLRSSDSVARLDTATPKSAVSRLGGDEFTFVLTGITEAHDARRAAHRVLEALRRPFRIDGGEVLATASIGIAIFPFDGDDMPALLKSADTAMYWAKSRGRNNYQFYSESMNETARRKLDLESRLRRALESDGLSLSYQPMFASGSGAIASTEALLRWEDPEIGPVEPSEFIPIAEDSGLILAIGEWVLRMACGQARMWQEAGFQPLRMAVNVSGIQLRQSRFPDMVSQALRESGLSPEHLEIEITESTIMQNDPVTVNSLRALDEMGVGLALDDFGTGYSSLSYLRRFPITRLKIDRSFVSELSTNPEVAALTEAIVTMASALRLKVVAEGVETLEQAEYLRGLGCDEFQGHFFSQAVPPNELTKFLERAKDD
jgi:diguanylate cyclase (GGDEF)-like protein